jgi:hypothetical protein
LHVVVVELTHPFAPTQAPPDEAAARRTLRGQIARLERELGDTVLAAFPHVRAQPAGGRHGAGPRILSLGELEEVRDDLADRLHGARLVVSERAELESRSRALLEEMLRDPSPHRHTTIPLADLGQPGCGAYSVKPRLGLIGMLMDWWHIKLSSGCPLPTPA